MLLNVLAEVVLQECSGSSWPESLVSMWSPLGYPFDRRDMKAQKPLTPATLAAEPAPL